jgi:hypothetical protein
MTASVSLPPIADIKRESDVPPRTVELLGLNEMLQHGPASQLGS